MTSIRFRSKGYAKIKGQFQEMRMKLIPILAMAVLAIPGERGCRRRKLEPQ